VERLHRGLDRKLTLICAPAGYGKTTLACMWLQDCARPAAWLSLDENDSDLRVFLSYLVASIQTVFPDACPTTLGFLRAPQLPPLDLMATTLVNDIADLPEPFILTLDDYHAIQYNTVHELVATLIGNLPRHAHLVLVSRVDPPWPLASLRAGRAAVGQDQVEVGGLVVTEDGLAFADAVATLGEGEEEAASEEEEDEEKYGRTAANYQPI